MNKYPFACLIYIIPKGVIVFERVTKTDYPLVFYTPWSLQNMYVYIMYCSTVNVSIICFR